MTPDDIAAQREFSCVYSSPARQATSPPPSSPNSSATDTRSSAWPARTPRPRPSPALGAEVLRGDLDDLDGLRAAAAAADGVIHLAFKHEGMREGAFMRAVDADLAAVQALGAGLIGTDKPFVTTGGTLMLAMAGITGRPGTEDDQSEGGPRIDAANYTIGLARPGRALLRRAARADGPQRPRPPRLHPRADRRSPGRTGWRPTPATARTAGPRPTPTTSASSTGWRWRRPPRARRCTASAIPASPAR